MTCVVGLVKSGVAYVGADSASVCGYETRVTRLPKVFRRGGFLIGYTSSFRMGQLLQYQLDVPLQGGEPDDVYMVQTFVEAVRNLLKDHGYARVENNVESGGAFLVGYRGRLYSVQSDFQVNETADGFEAIGAGREYALGAMRVLKHLGPKKRIKKALEASAHFCNAVAGPFRVVSERGG
ncbi:MAG: hypothetical protein PVF45_02740 [Anaerolineae bacterium]|jgi:ATP-dependent protease HslVU (ClpYQ) peptidase subunit